MESILTRANEQGTQDFTVNVTDSAGSPVVPIAFKWHLTNRDGTTIINSRQDVIVTPASTVTITLSGDDLQILDQANKEEYRILTVETDRGDVNEPQIMEAHFWVKNMVYKT